MLSNPTGRFAPSPTGRMHAGNIFAALISWLIIKGSEGDIVLRIEDLDRDRSRQEYADQIMRDFESLGLTWDRGPYYQHDRSDVYREAFEALSRDGMVYPCFCTRAEVNAVSAPHRSEYGIYPGTCRDLSEDERKRRTDRLKEVGRCASYRIKVNDEVFAFDDLLQGHQTSSLRGPGDDFVVRRSDGAFAYQLAVVIDDAEQGIDCVVRGCDLIPSTPKQMMLQRYLMLPSVCYAHVPLFVDEKGRRLAKRNKSAEYGELLSIHKTPEAVLGNIAYVGGLIPEEVPISASQLLKIITLNDLKKVYCGKEAIMFVSHVSN